MRHCGGILDPLCRLDFQLATAYVLSSRAKWYVVLIPCTCPFIALDYKFMPVPRPYNAPAGNGIYIGNTPKCLNRPKSLAVSTPTKLLNMEDARALGLGHTSAFDQKFIEVGEGPGNLPKYHTVIDLPSR